MPSPVHQLAGEVGLNPQVTQPAGEIPGFVIFGCENPPAHTPTDRSLPHPHSADAIRPAQLFGQAIARPGRQPLADFPAAFAAQTVLPVALTNWPLLTQPKPNQPPRDFLPAYRHPAGTAVGCADIADDTDRHHPPLQAAKPPTEETTEQPTYFDSSFSPHYQPWIKPSPAPPEYPPRQ